MKIDLNYLKFHSFKYDKNYHNLISKKEMNSDYFDKLLYSNNQSLLIILNEVKKTKYFNEFKNSLLRFHSLEEEKKYLFYKIISKKHPTLKLSLDQLYSSYKKYNLYQLKLSKSERLIFIWHKNILNEEEIFIPLLFDLNHCFYSNNKDKKYDNNFKKKKEDWNFKDRQQEIKYKLLNYNT